MNTTDNGRAEARVRANRRLRTITVGTTLAALAATGGLGWLAAVTHSGTTASAATTAVGSSAATTTTAGTTTARTARTRTGASTTVANSAGAAHASSGGS